jgi:hypothetical protein
VTRLLHRAELVAEILVTHAHSRLLLRRRGLRSALGSLRSGNVPLRHDPAAARRLGLAVARVLRVVPGDGRCLSQALVLSRLLARRGMGADLVIAVRSQPFAAHAWLEAGGQPLLPPAGPEFKRLTEM